mmetsp:Transcript_24896/g.53712  ORF Transcript_24896/g.53712 Transcript_24896/m.53712 type:complete len:212 (-) Transcript_24896:314-949(-)|eukprot:CAMPEP_0172300464 /NCGR_PEP_ID=MMETSP1058-20130122/2547_1 /TAXON_ID=83371 /ORGANISM="Detonula confervacea, Strain CCMP 353" /LENGTH=211 /DNA_ID=CAMNT_0013010243 /DNA_START=55 /DNA_END=690 /DNA_ORIENTATION=+
MVSSSRTRIIAYTAAVAFAAATPLAAAFVGSPNNYDSITRSRVSTVLHESRNNDPSSDSSRRAFLSTVAAAASIAVVPFQPAFAAEDSKDSLIADLNDSLSKVQAIPALLESAEWDKVRTVLKTPPVNQLWNLGESKNTLVRLAKETGDFDLMEMKDELAISLQMTDQYAYDNNFIYYQPGNGKLKTKEPLQMANKAISQLKEAVAAASSD